MTFLKRYLNEILLSIGLLAAYLFTRLYNIMSLPIFTDEAIYTRWSQIARYDASWRFISLTDGKQPSFVWIDMILMRFVNDPLLAGRLVSVLAGMVSLVGIYFLAKEIFKNKRIGYIAAIIYIIYPFSLVYDRMALYESLVSAAIIWALYLGVLLIRLRRLDVALILGMVMGAGVLTKSSAFFAIYLLPLSLLLFDFRQKRWKGELIKWAALAGLASVMAFGFYSIQRLSPFFHIIEQKTTVFVYPIREWISHPFDFFIGNLNGLTSWLIDYITYPFLILILISFFLGRNLREKLFLLSWFIVPFILLALFGRVLYPRFILFMTMPLLVLGAFSINYILENVRSNLLKLGLIFVFLVLFLRSNFYILTDFAHAPIPKADTDQFMNEWPAGGGIQEVINLLEEKAKKEKIYVLTGGTFGSLPTYAMEIYLDENKNIEKRGIHPIPKNIPEDLLERAKLMPTFVFMSNQKEFEENIKGWPIKLIAEYRKGIGTAYTRLYEVIPSN
jgi:4-amino-4-deoxy-L-arabinose transferase-like glycosyltransferase